MTALLAMSSPHPGTITTVLMEDDGRCYVEVLTPAGRSFTPVSDDEAARAMEWCES